MCNEAAMIYFLSDAHLGSRALPDAADNQRKVVDLLRRMERDAEAVYMLGDMFDFWYEYLWHDPTKAEYTPFLDQLQSMTRKGIRIHYFVGNHDLWTFGWLARRTGVVIHRNPETVTCYGKTIFLGHGDGVMPSDWQTLYPPFILKKIKRFMFLRRVFHSRPLQHLFRLVPPKWGNAFGYNWAADSRRKELAKPCPYKGEQQEELVLFAKEQERIGNHHDYYVFGHRHIELDLQITRNSRVLILGDCFQQWTYAALSPQGEWAMYNA